MTAGDPGLGTKMGTLPQQHTSHVATHWHSFVALLAPIQFKHLRTPMGYPKKIVTLGDHIRSARLERHEYQKDVAKFIGVGVETILHWELNQTQVTIPHYPMVMQYLGYCPLPDDFANPSLGTLVHRHRIHRGLTIRKRHH